MVQTSLSQIFTNPQNRGLVSEIFPIDMDMIYDTSH